MATPKLWSEIEQSPEFSNLPPEKKIQSLSEWEKGALSAAETPEQAELFSAFADRKKRRILGETVPEAPLSEYLPFYRERKQQEEFSKKGILGKAAETIFSPIAEVGQELMAGTKEALTGASGAIPATLGDEESMAGVLASMNQQQKESKKLRTAEQARFDADMEKAAQDFTEAKGFLPKAKELYEWAAAAGSYPLQSLKMAARSAPNALVTSTIGIVGRALGTLAGTAAGAPTGPAAIATGLAGGVLGGSVANYAIEAAGQVYEQLLQATNGAAANMSEAEIADFLKKNPEILAEGRKKAAIRSSAIGAVEAVTGGLAGKVANVGESVAKKTVANIAKEKGFDSAEELLKKSVTDQALRQEIGAAVGTAMRGVSKAEKAARFGTGMALETLGEGAGEAAAGYAAEGKVDPLAVFQETLAGGVTSAATVAGQKAVSKIFGTFGKLSKAQDLADNSREVAPATNQAANQELQKAADLSAQAESDDFNLTLEEELSAAEKQAEEALKNAEEQTQTKPTTDANEIEETGGLPTVEGQPIDQEAARQAQEGTAQREGESQDPLTVAALETVAKNTATPAVLAALEQRGLVRMVEGQPVITDAGLRQMPEEARPRLTEAEREAEIQGMAPAVTPAVLQPGGVEGAATLAKAGAVRTRPQTPPVEAAAPPVEEVAPATAAAAAAAGIPTAEAAAPAPAPAAEAAAPAVEAAAPAVEAAAPATEAAAPAAPAAEAAAPAAEAAAPASPTAEAAATAPTVEAAVPAAEAAPEVEEAPAAARTEASPSPKEAEDNQRKASVDTVPPDADPVSGAPTQKDIEEGLKLVDSLIANIRGAVVYDSLENLLQREDLSEDEKNAIRESETQGIYSRGRAIIATNKIRKGTRYTTVGQAVAAVIFHEVMHYGSDVIKNSPQHADLYSSWLKMLSDNVPDSRLDYLVKKGYSYLSDWSEDPEKKLHAQEEVFVQDLTDLFNRRGNLSFKERNRLKRFMNWIARLVNRTLKTNFSTKINDAILEDWGRKFVSAVSTSNDVRNANSDDFIQRMIRIGGTIKESDRQALREIQDLGTSTEEVSGNPNERLSKDKNVIFEVSVSGSGLRINSIFTLPDSRGKGSASSLLNSVLEIADKYGSKVTLSPGAFGEGGLTDTQLQDWYSRKGFQLDDRGNMTRQSSTASPDIRRSIGMVSPEEDAEYLAAVKAGDTEKAQRMVNEAAKRAGYNVPNVGNGITYTKDDTPSFVYDERFNVSFSGGVFGFYFSDSPEVWKSYSQPRYQGEQGKINKVSLRIQNPLFFENEMLSVDEFFKKLESSGVTIPQTVRSQIERMKNAGGLQERTPVWAFLSSDFMNGGDAYARDLKNAIQAAGYDAVIHQDSSLVGTVLETPATSYVVFKPEQIKLSDPITRDDAGNVIPLSQRFQKASPDIRRSIEMGMDTRDTTPRTANDILNTYSEEELQGVDEFISKNPTFNKIKQFLGIEQAAEIGSIERIKNLSEKAQSFIGFTYRKNLVPAINKKATEKAYATALELVNPKSRFGQQYQMQNGGPESAATAVLQMELVRYGLALAAKGDPRLLAILRKNWNGVILGSYITATSAGRILNVRSKYVSEVLRTLDTVSREVDKVAKTHLEKYGFTEEGAAKLLNELKDAMTQTEVDQQIRKEFLDSLEEKLKANPQAMSSMEELINSAMESVSSDFRNNFKSLLQDITLLGKLRQHQKNLTDASIKRAFFDEFENGAIPELPNDPDELANMIAQVEARAQETMNKLLKAEVSKQRAKAKTKKTPATPTTAGQAVSNQEASDMDSAETEDEATKAARKLIDSMKSFLDRKFDKEKLDPSVFEQIKELVDIAIANPDDYPFEDFSTILRGKLARFAIKEDVLNDLVTNSFTVFSRYVQKDAEATAKRLSDDTVKGKTLLPERVQAFRDLVKSAVVNKENLGQVDFEEYYTEALREFGIDADTVASIVKDAYRKGSKAAAESAERRNNRLQQEVRLLTSQKIGEAQPPAAKAKTKTWRNTLADFVRENQDTAEDEFVNQLTAKLVFFGIDQEDANNLATATFIEVQEDKAKGEADREAKRVEAMNNSANLLVDKFLGKAPAKTRPKKESFVPIIFDALKNSADLSEDDFIANLQQKLEAFGFIPEVANNLAMATRIKSEEAKTAKAAAKDEAIQKKMVNLTSKMLGLTTKTPAGPEKATISSVLEEAVKNKNNLNQTDFVALLAPKLEEFGGSPQNARDLAEAAFLKSKELKAEENRKAAAAYAKSIQGIITNLAGGTVPKSKKTPTNLQQIRKILVDAIKNAENLDAGAFQAKYTLLLERLVGDATKTAEMVNNAYSKSIETKDEALTKRSDRIKDALYGGARARLVDTIMAGASQTDIVDPAWRAEKMMEILSSMGLTEQESADILSKFNNSEIESVLTNNLDPTKTLSILKRAQAYVALFANKYEKELNNPKKDEDKARLMSLRGLMEAQSKVSLPLDVFVNQAKEFGATQDQAERLFKLAAKKAEENASNNKFKTRWGSLVDYVLSNPSLMNDPGKRQVALEGFLRDNGFDEVAIRSILPAILSDATTYFDRAMEKHMQDTLKKLEDRRKKAEKTRQEKRQKINDVAEMSEDAFKKLKKDLELIRSGLAKSDNDVAKALAKELGFEGFLPTDMQSLAELEFKITEAMAEGRAHDVAEGLRELYELASRRKAPKSLLEYMSIIYTSNALSGISTHAVNIEAPIGEFALRVITDITRSIATGNLSQAVNNLLIAVDSVIKSLRELSYGLFGGASVVTVSQQIQRVTAIQGDIKAAKQSLSKGSKSSILQKLKAIYVLGHSISDISRRVLSTYDNVAFTTFHNYLQKTGASELMLRAGMDKAKVLPTVLSMSLRSSDLVSSELSIINDLMSQLDSVGFDPTQSLAILETESSNLGTNRELATFKRDFIGGIRRTVNAFPDPKQLRRKLFREGLHQKNMVYIRAKERTNKDIFDLVRSELEKKMPSAEAQKEVNDIVLGSQRESEFILGYERDEVPVWDPLGFIFNVIRTGTQPIVRKYPIFGRMVFGFIMMPINLAERAMWFTPYGLLRLGLNKWGNKSGKFYQQSMGTQHQARQRRTEALAGISFMTLLFSMKLLSDANDDDEFEFVVDGAGPRNKTERDAFLKVGRKPFSFGLRYKDKYYLLNWGRGFFETLKPVFLMVGAVEDMKLNKKTSDSEEFVPLQYLGTLLNGWVSQNSFVGVKNSAGAAFQLDPDAAFVSLGQLMFKATPLIFPLSGFSASLEKLISGNEAYKSGMGAIWSNIPVARSLLTNKAVNALGDPIGANFTNGWAKANDRTWAAGMPFLISGTPTVRDQAVYGLIIERGVAPGMPSRPALEDKYGPMEDKTWLDYVAYRGSLIKSGIYNRINVLKRMDSEQLQKAFGQISEDATARAKAKFRFVGPPRVK